MLFTLRIDSLHLATAIFVVQAKIEDVERQRRFFPDDQITAEQAAMRSRYLTQLHDCLDALEPGLLSCCASAS